MATRADESLIAAPSTALGDDALDGEHARKADEIRDEIAKTRDRMAQTVEAIEERLSPKHLKEQVTSVKEHLKEQVTSAKDHLLGELDEAKAHIKDEVKSELFTAKKKVRQATVGRVENMVHDARDTVTEAGSSVIDTVKENPIPAALVAVGLGWLVMSGLRGGARAAGSRARDRWYGYREGGPYVGVSGSDLDDAPYAYRYEGGRSAVRGPKRLVTQGKRAAAGVAGKAKGVARGVGEGVSGVAHDVGDAVSTVAQDVGEGVASAAHDASRKAAKLARDARTTSRRMVRRTEMEVRRAERSVATQLRENPLAFGAIAIAVGAAVGLLLPHTEVEDRTIGTAKDKLVDQAKTAMQGAAQQAIESVEGKAGSLIDRAGEAHAAHGHGGHGVANGKSTGVANGLSGHASKHT